MRGHLKRVVLGTVWCASAVSLLLLFAGTVAAVPAPRAGTFLVAEASLHDPHFYRTVILLLHHDAEGSVGLVINQQSDLSPAKLLADIAGLDRYRGALFIGGPVDVRRVSVLSSSNEAGDAVLDGVYLTHDAQALERLVAAGNLEQDTLRIFIGYAGWTAKQLEQEIARGSWRVLTASARQVFSQPPGSLWQSLQPPSELLNARVTPTMGRPPDSRYRGNIRLR